MTRTTILKTVGLALVLAAIAWGARVTVLEGFILEWPRHFQGDFAVVMYWKDYKANFWDGTGIAYGPIFVIESWLVTRWPQLFTIYFFAFANVVLAAGAFVLCIRASRVSSPGIVLLGLAAWLCYWRLFYAFSVAANPEFLELFFLSFAWFVASRSREVTEGVLIAAAALTKLIPWIFIVPLVLRRSVRALTAAAIVAAATLLLVALGQGMSPFEAVLRSIVPKNKPPGGLMVPGLRSQVQQGLLEAIARLLNWTGDQPPVGGDLRIVQAVFVTVVGLALALTVWSSMRLIRRRQQIGLGSYLALTYAMYFALLPVLHLQAHPHTFLFLLPVWIAMADQLWKDPSPIMTRAAFAAAVAFCYVATGFPVALMILDRLFKTSLLSTWMGTEPMLGTVLLLLVIWSYIAVRTAAVTEQPRTSAAPAPSGAVPA
jgi:hypothetical protein